MVHREHAVVETAGVRTAKAMGLREPAVEDLAGQRGWVIAANIAADLAAWTRLLGHHDDATCGKPTRTRSATASGTSPPASRITPAQRVLKISPDWPWKEAFLTCWQRLCALPAPA